ncbi:MAG: TIGR01440 family protein [Clostridia bacterium]|nr:TIGR01440 family protein [Clostridia bacterium]
MFEQIASQSKAAINELLDIALPKPGQIIVIGCSSSEIMGGKIGHGSVPEAAEAVFQAISPVVKDKGLYLAAQCCEHLNRALVIERQAAEKFGLEIVSAVPKPKAGGSFAAAAYLAFSDPVLVEHVKAEAGLDIGCTMIGMHLKDVAVPLRLENNRIGQALVLAARTRPKYVGGARAQYE